MPPATPRKAAPIESCRTAQEAVKNPDVYDGTGDSLGRRTLIGGVRRIASSAARCVVRPGDGSNAELTALVRQRVLDPSVERRPPVTLPAGCA